MKYQARSKVHNQKIEDPGRGKHLWIMTAAFRIQQPSKVADPDTEMHMDMENLLTVEGPGCWKCERPWTADFERRFCQGLM